MPPTTTQIAEAFSGGKFEFAYPYLSDDIKWNIVGDKILSGKNDLIKFCDQTAEYFLTVTTRFNMSNVIVGDNTVAINGTAEFINKENKKTVVASCDVYIFENGKLKEVTSYCITTGRD
jgi:SnoaL-like domain